MKNLIALASIALLSCSMVTAQSSDSSSANQTTTTEHAKHARDKFHASGGQERSVRQHCGSGW